MIVILTRLSQYGQSPQLSSSSSSMSMSLMSSSTSGHSPLLIFSLFTKLSGSEKILKQNSTMPLFQTFFRKFSNCYLYLGHCFVFSFVSVTNYQNVSIKMWICLWRNIRRIRSSWTRQYLFVWFIPVGLVCSKSQYKLPSPCSWCRRGETLK